jgi:hypothetical protein
LTDAEGGELMSKLIIVALVTVLVLAVAAVAYAVSQSVIDAIIDDAQDGTIDGDWTVEELMAALAYLRDDPLYKQYTDIEGVIEDYLAGLQDPGVAGADELAFTGAEILLLLGAGAGLAGSGALLRRRRD